MRGELTLTGELLLPRHATPASACCCMGVCVPAAGAIPWELPLLPTAQSRPVLPMLLSTYPPTFSCDCRHYAGLEPKPTQFRTCIREDGTMEHVSVKLGEAGGLHACVRAYVHACGILHCPALPACHPSSSASTCPASLTAAHACRCRWTTFWGTSPVFITHANTTLLPARNPQPPTLLTRR